MRARCRRPDGEVVLSMDVGIVAWVVMFVVAFGVMALAFFSDSL